MPLGKQRILAAYLSRNELFQQAQMLTSMTNPSDMAQFWADYAAAKSELAKLSPAPTAPPMFLPMAAQSASHISRVEGTAAFQEAFGGTDYKFFQTPIDRLTSIQTFCNVEPALPPPPSANLPSLLEYALPADPTIPGEITVTPTGFRFSTTRYGHGPGNLRRRIRDGAATLFFEHPNLVQVRKFGDKLILLNGTHRALELHKAGATHIPSLVIEHQNFNEIEWPQGLGYWPQLFLSSVKRPPEPRLPVVPDFLSRLAVECPVVLGSTAFELNLVGPQVPQQIQIPLRLGGPGP